MRGKTALRLGVLIAALLATACASPTNTPSPTPTPSFKDIINSTKPAVVRVETNRSVGSGFTFDSQGYVLTAYHVVESAESISVEMTDGTKQTAELTKWDEQRDLAVLKIPSLLVKTLVVAERDCEVADEVAAIGYALDLTGGVTVSRGIVSAKRLEGGISYIQTDAAVNPGSSGGPLINMQGQVVGMNVGIIRLEKGVPIEGMNFAVSAESFADVVGRSLYVGAAARWVTPTPTRPPMQTPPATWTPRPIPTATPTLAFTPIVRHSMGPADAPVAVVEVSDFQ